MEKEMELKALLERKINRALGRRSGEISFSLDELDTTLDVVTDLSARVVALEKENSHLSLFGLQRNQA